jgi:hypothetical protein
MPLLFRIPVDVLHVACVGAGVAGVLLMGILYAVRRRPNRDQFLIGHRNAFAKEYYGDTRGGFAGVHAQKECWAAATPGQVAERRNSRRIAGDETAPAQSRRRRRAGGRPQKLVN